MSYRYYFSLILNVQIFVDKIPGDRKYTVYTSFKNYEQC